MTKVAASIRCRNPGAMWPGEASRKFGSKKFEQLKDGQKNQIAQFASYVDGAAAQFYLLSNPKYYLGHTVGQAIATWSGGNDVNAYLGVIEKYGGLKRDDYIDLSLLMDELKAVKFAKAMARHEAGKVYPMTDAEWSEAHAKFVAVYNGAKPVVAPTVTLRTAALELARANLGQKEVKGNEDNPFIMDCYAAIGRPEIAHDETPWCAAFVGAMLKEAGYAYKVKSLLARDYLDYGEVISEPEEGCVVVQWRGDPKSYQGHVAFVESWTDKTVTVIGGNQGDAVSRMTVPRAGAQSQILGYRRPIPAKAPVSEIAQNKSVRYKGAALFIAIQTFLWNAWDSVTNGAIHAWNYVGDYITVIPGVSSSTVATLKSTQAIVSAGGLPWPVNMSIAFVAVILLYNLWSTISRLRERREAEQAGGAV